MKVDYRAAGQTSWGDDRGAPNHRDLDVGGTRQRDTIARHLGKTMRCLQ